MQSERSSWCSTISGATTQRTFPIASASKKSLRISPTKKPKNGVAIRVGRPSTNPLRLYHDELRVVIIFALVFIVAASQFPKQLVTARVRDQFSAFVLESEIE